MAAYVRPGTTLQLAHDSRRAPVASQRSAMVGDLPATHQDIVLAEGDVLVLTREDTPGRIAVTDGDGRVIEPARISTTLPEIFEDVRPGERVWLDDGKIGGVIRGVTRDRIEIAMTHVRPGGSKLGSDKGINLPDSLLRLPPLTAKDLADLPFIASHADLVGYSFVRTAADVHELQARLAQLGGRDLAIILKIETRRAFDNLPALLLAAMRSPSAGVMIARGDLAVECGYERLAEVQEECCGCRKRRTCPSSGRPRYWKASPRTAFHRAPKLQTRQWASVRCALLTTSCGACRHISTRKAQCSASCSSRSASLGGVPTFRSTAPRSA